MSQKFNIRFGIVLKQARQKEGITQQSLSEKTGVQRGFISDLETGKKGLSLEKFVQICSGLESSAPSDLLSQLEKEPTSR